MGRPFITSLISFTVLCPQGFHAAAADSMSASQRAAMSVSAGGSLLQVHRHEFASKPVSEVAAPANTPNKQPDPASAPKCPPLPAGAQMCQVRLEGHAPYNMAVRSTNDVVSYHVCSYGHWEVNDTSKFGTPGKAMDIGGNMGYFTFMLAAAGWEVHTFEPMQVNLDLIHATLCANPDLASRIQLHPHGLGQNNSRCQFVFHKTNKGNGITRCTGDTNMWWANMDEYTTDGTEFQIRNFNEVLTEIKPDRVDFVKLDVEGYECEVLKGAPTFLKDFSPRLIRTEAWAYLERCGTAKDYLDMFISNNYTVSKHSSCEPTPDRTFGDYWACKN
jgi:FkbM family methyltransferase